MAGWSASADALLKFIIAPFVTMLFEPRIVGQLRC
jgi:hypothetical protein